MFNFTTDASENVSGSWNSVFSKLFPFLNAGSAKQKTSTFVKRSFDIVVSLTTLIVLFPFFLLVAIAIKRDTPGPVFYRGDRIGFGGKTFKILKFRTMFETPESYAGPSVTAKDDVRITPLGRWLRDTKINEFPQFWNVLVGDMSIVGPRPEDPKLAKTWPRDVAQQILSVRPGITSPASVLYRDEESLLSVKNVLQKYLSDLSPDKMRLDLLYVRHQSLLLDIDVMFWTFMIVIPIIGSKNPPEDFLFVGPMTRLIRRYVNWFTLDMAVTFGAIGIVHFIWQYINPFSVDWKIGLIYAFIFSLLFSVVGAFLGVNDIQWSKASSMDITRVLPSWLIASVISVALSSWFDIHPPLFIPTALSLSLFGYFVVRYNERLALFTLSLLARYLRSTIASERVLIVGSGRTAETVTWVLKHPTYSNKFHIAGYVDSDIFTKGMRIYGARVLGGYDQIPELVETHDIQMVVLADNRISLKDYQTITTICNDRSIRFAVIPDVFGSLNRLFETPAFSPPKLLKEYSSEEAAVSSIKGGDSSPCHFCVGRYTRLETELQIEHLKE